MLTSATSASGHLTVQGSLRGAPDATFDLDFFSNNACDAPGNGGGQNYIGSVTVTSNAAGEVSFEATFSAAVRVGTFMTATATDAANNTSEFSLCIPVAAGAPVPKLSIAKSADGNGLTLSWPASVTGSIVETADSFSPPVVWSQVATRPNVTGDQNTIRIDTTPGSRFYRIRKQ